MKNQIRDRDEMRDRAEIMFFKPFCSPRFGQFISSTLPTFAVCEKFVVMEVSNEEKIDGGNNIICFKQASVWDEAGC